MRVLLLFDLGETPKSGETYAEDLKTEDWEGEAAVLSAMRAAGHDVKLFGLCDNLNELLSEIASFKPDLIFNLAEAIRGARKLEPNIAGLFESIDMRFTGASSKTLQICKDKALSKKLVAYHGVRVPRFELVPRAQAVASPLKSFPYPALVKPVGLESSTGIARGSFVETEKDCRARVQFIHERLDEDALVEEYIEGRELYVSMMGHWDRGKIEVFPLRELYFDAVPDGDPKFATYKAKWDDDYRRKWGIKNGFARTLGAELTEKVIETSRVIYRALQINGYARLDLRISPDGEIVFIEANPNPSIAATDDFAQSALKGGLSYDKLISKILKLSGA